MLLTMEAAYADEWRYFPNPERIDKVKISMENLETVVRERNKAYHLLETGYSGERPAKVVNTPLGERLRKRKKTMIILMFYNIFRFENGL